MMSRNELVLKFDWSVGIPNAIGTVENCYSTSCGFANIIDIYIYIRH